MEAPTQLRGLRSLRLALSDVRELALALPSLTTLDVNGCAGLASLELRCPALLHGLFQSVGRCVLSDVVRYYQVAFNLSIHGRALPLSILMVIALCHRRLVAGS